MGVINEILNINENTIYGKKTKEINTFLILKTADTEKETKELISKISSVIKLEHLIGYKNDGKSSKFKHPDKCKSDEEKNCFSSTKNKNGNFKKKPEDNLERIIKLAWKKSGKNGVYENQYPIPETDNGSHIDLLMKKDDFIEFVELKQWKNDLNSPAFAIAENIKNLYLFLNFNRHLFSDYAFKKGFNRDEYKKLHDIEGKNKFILTVLAPEEYYFDWFNNSKELKEAFYEFCRFLEKFVALDLKEKLNLNVKIEIKILSFHFSRDDYEKRIDRIIRDKMAENKKEFGRELFEKKGKTSKGSIIRLNTGEIDLSRYIENCDDYFSKEICSQITDWKNVL